MASADATAESASVQMATLNNLPMREYTCTTSTTARTAFMHVKARQGEYLHQAWGFDAGKAALVVTFPQGTIIDVDITHYLADQGSAGVTYTVAAATLGVLYYLPLDGDTDAFLPVGLPTTT